MSDELVKWYFAVNEAGLEKAFPLIAVAVRSARATTFLEPTCLYCGRETPRLRQLEALGVAIRPHEPSLAADLRAGYGAKYDQFKGHWLRVDIPELEHEAEVVLYTDIDVMFRGLPARLPRPRYLAAAPGQDRSALAQFNSGVMVMNLAGMRAVHDRFLDAIRRRLRGDFTYPTHDQFSFNAFYGPLHDRLPDEMNWKPYWGANPAAHIIHFHGPKPDLAEAFAAGTRPAGGQLAELWRRAPDAYAADVAEFRRYEQGLDTKTPLPRQRCALVTSRMSGPQALRRLGLRARARLRGALGRR